MHRRRVGGCTRGELRSTCATHMDTCRMRRKEMLRGHILVQRLLASSFLTVALFGTITAAVDHAWIISAVSGIISALMLVLVVYGIRASDE